MLAQATASGVCHISKHAAPGRAPRFTARQASFSKSQVISSKRTLSSSSRSQGLQVQAASMYDFTVDNIDGKSVALSKYKNKNYKELVTVYNKYKSQGFEVLAFPCNQFGKQEPGSNAEIKAFAKKYGANFPLFAKIDVNGAGADPFYQYLKDTQKELLGKDVKWNFAKFLVDKEGKAVKRWAPTSSPLSITGDIEKYL